MGAIIVQFFIGLLVIVLAIYLGVKLYMKGYLAGMQREATEWLVAIGKVTPPNWQSLPSSVGVDPEQSKQARKLYADTFKTALFLIKQEVAANRMEALTQEYLKGDYAGPE